MSEDYKQGLVDALGELAWALDAQGRKADSLTCTRAAIELAGTPRTEGEAINLAEKFAAAYIHACDDEGTYFGLGKALYDEGAELLKRQLPQSYR